MICLTFVPVDDNAFDFEELQTKRSLKKYQSDFFKDLADYFEDN